MTISKKDWERYITLLRKLNTTSAEQMLHYIEKHGMEDPQKIIDYATQLAQKYGKGSGQLAAEMYDEIAQISGANVPAAEVANVATREEIAEALLDPLKKGSPKLVGNVVNAAVKRVSADTMTKNALRDGAEWAWIPNGDTCAFCLTIASNGWQRASENILKKGHAQHIHANCDCNFCVRFDSKTDVAGYHPEKYLEIYEDADGRSSKDKINAIRREQYAENKDKINAQKRAAYAERKEREENK